MPTLNLVTELTIDDLLNAVSQLDEEELAEEVEVKELDNYIAQIDQALEKTADDLLTRRRLYALYG